MPQTYSNVSVVCPGDQEPMEETVYRGAKAALDFATNQITLWEGDFADGHTLLFAGRSYTLQNINQGLQSPGWLIAAGFNEFIFSLG
jgi:hypothetical protein